MMRASILGDEQRTITSVEDEYPRPPRFGLHLPRPRGGPCATARLDGLAPVGARVDRYIVLARLGAGGMGVVYEAYDPRLDRKVALKLVGQGRRRGKRHERLLREARALARLSHPRVVSVYDSGVIDGRPYVAMELVRGQTARAWQQRQLGGWEPTLRLWLDVARGLQAVHDAGLVHRDVKPDNVLVTAMNRPVLIDFGLARRGCEPTPGSVPSEPLSWDPITREGVVAGSPAYMAPELHHGQGADPRSDQFAWCVCVWEALYGQRPFDPHPPGRGRDARPRSPLPPLSDVAPRWLREILERGSSAEPRDRWPSMDSLICACEARCGRVHA